MDTYIGHSFATSNRSFFNHWRHEAHEYSDGEAQMWMAKTGYCHDWVVEMQTDNLTPILFPVLAAADAGSCVGPQNKRGRPAHRYRQRMQVPELIAHGISLGS